MEPLRPPDSGSTTRKRGKRTGDTRTHAGGFAKRLEAAETTEPAPVAHIVDAPHVDEVDAGVEALLDDVHERGQELLDRRTYSAAQRYRSAIRAFLRRVVPEAVSVESVDSSHGILNRKRYTLLTEVDRRVDRLIQGVLQSQSQQIEIVARLKEIEGMLVDLLH